MQVRSVQSSSDNQQLFFFCEGHEVRGEVTQFLPRMKERNRPFEIEWSVFSLQATRYSLEN